MNLLKKADDIYISFGAPKEVQGQSSDKTEALYQEAKQAGLEFIPMEIRHLGTENCVPLLKRIRGAMGEDQTAIVGSKTLEPADRAKVTILVNNFIDIKK